MTHARTHTRPLPQSMGGRGCGVLGVGGLRVGVMAMVGGRKEREGLREGRSGYKERENGKGME